MRILLHFQYLLYVGKQFPTGRVAFLRAFRQHPLDQRCQVIELFRQCGNWQLNMIQSGAGMAIAFEGVVTE